MHHLAILRKHWKLTERIISGEKTVEARFSKKTYPPWNRVKEGDDLFFMNALEPVKAHARVEAVVQFDNLTPKRVREIIDDYKLMMAFTQAEVETLKTLYAPRRYCVLIFLADCTEIQPIRITKNLYGSTAKWITLEDIESMRRTETIREIWDRIDLSRYCLFEF